MVTKWLKRQGYSLTSDIMRTLQAEWLAWYRGYVQDKHNYTVYNGQRVQDCKRRTLGMAKVVCEDYASLLVNERVQITADAMPDLPDILEHNCFMTRMNRLAEITMALGTGATVEFLDEHGAPIIDYIRAEYIYPLSWDGDKVQECAFASRKTIGNGTQAQEVYYIQLHTKVGDGWQIRNVYLSSSGEELPLPEGMADVTPVSPVPLFQIVRPNKVNTTDLDSPLGASVYADALEQLYDCDVVWDSYINEFILGKKRLMVPVSLAKLLMHQDASGNERLAPMFDPNDALFYVYEAGEDGQQKPIELDMALRTEEHDQGLQRCVDMVSKKCGLGMGRYRFDNVITSTTKTATEVISTKSDLFQSLKRHEKTFGDAIISMVRALAWLTGKPYDLDVSVNFDDSVIEDEGKKTERTIQLQQAGLISRKDAIMTIFECSEDDAQRRLAEIIAEEQGVDTALDVPDKQAAEAVEDGNEPTANETRAAEE